MKKILLLFTIFILGFIVNSYAQSDTTTLKKSSKQKPKANQISISANYSKLKPSYIKNNYLLWEKPNSKSLEFNYYRKIFKPLFLGVFLGKSNYSYNEKFDAPNEYFINHKFEFLNYGIKVKLDFSISKNIAFYCEFGILVNELKYNKATASSKGVFRSDFVYFANNSKTNSVNFSLGTHIKIYKFFGLIVKGNYVKDLKPLIRTMPPSGGLDGYTIEQYFTRMGFNAGLQFSF